MRLRSWLRAWVVFALCLLAAWAQPGAAEEPLEPPASTATETDAGAAAPDAGAVEADEDALVAFMARPWTGGLEGILARGYLRVGVAYGPPFFLYDRGSQIGLSVDLARELEKYLRSKLGKPARTLTVTLVPLPRDAMIGALLVGRVDLLTANLTITPERAAQVAFTDPLLTGVSEIVVSGPAAPEIADFDDLAGIELPVRVSSSYHGHLAALNAARAAEGLEEMPVVAVDENLEDFDLLELVDVGVLPAAIVDLHKAELYAQMFENLTLHRDLAIHEDGEIAWAVRPDSPQLLAALDGFVATARKGTLLGNILYRRWLQDGERVRNAMAPGEDAKFRTTIDFIRTHADSYAFDPILIVAQGYQESRLDQSKRSKAGAIGIMQVLPSTARDPNVGIPDIEEAERNVEAGVKYLRFLRDRYFSDPGMSDLDRTLFSFAAYNAGPSNIRKARRRAEKMGLDPNVWFGHVELAAARVISREPVVYVRNILKYYTTYRFALERREADAG